MPKMTEHDEVNMKNSEDRLVSKREACALLGGICLGTLNTMLKNKHLPSRYVGRRRFIPLAAIRRYIERGPTTAYSLMRDRSKDRAYKR